MKFLNLSKKAFTLVELLLVVGIAAVLSVGLYAVYERYKIFNKANLVQADVIAVSTAIDQLLDSGYTYGPSPYGSMALDLYNTKLLPSNYDVITEYYVYSKNSGTYIDIGGYNTTYNYGGLGFQDLDTGVCRALVNRLYANFNQIIPYSAVGGMLPGSYNETPAVKPVVTRIEQACEDYNDNGKISLMFLKKRGANGGYLIPYS